MPVTKPSGNLTWLAIGKSPVLKRRFTSTQMVVFSIVKLSSSFSGVPYFATFRVVKRPTHRHSRHVCQGWWISLWHPSSWCPLIRRALQSPTMIQNPYAMPLKFKKFFAFWSRHQKIPSTTSEISIFRAGKCLHVYKYFLSSPTCKPSNLR